jgi:hypothetical protein
VSPGPSQSHHSGLDPRTRGGNSIWTPHPGQVDRVGGMQPPEGLGDGVDVGADVVGRQRAPQRVADVLGEGAVGAAEQQRSEETPPAVPVHGDHDVDVIDEGRQGGRMLVGITWIDGQVVAHARRLDHAVARCAGLLGGRRAITSVIASSAPPWYAMNPMRPRSSLTSSTPGWARRAAKADIAPMIAASRA